MPQIPIYNQPQVAPAPDPGVKFNPQVGGDAFGVGIGEAASHAVDVVHNVYQQAQALKSEQGITHLQQIQQQLGLGDGQSEPGAFNVKGLGVLPADGASPTEDAGKPLVERYMPKVQTATEQIAAGISDPGARQMFLNNAAKLNMSFEGQLRNHENKQSAIAMQDVVSNGIDSATQAAATATQTGDMDSVEMNKQRAVQLARQYAVMTGADPDVAQQTATSQIGSAVLQTMLSSGNPNAAKQYFEDNKDDFTLQAQEQFGKQIQAKSEVQNAFSSANSVYDEVASKSPGNTPDLKEITDKLRTMYANDPEGYSRAVAVAKERLGDQVEASKQQDYQNKGTLWKGIVNGGSLSAALKSDEFSKLTGEDQANFISSVERYQKRNQTGGEDQSLDHLANYYSVLRHPEDLKSMSDDQILMMAPDVGKAGVQKLLQKKMDLNNPAKEPTDSLATDKFNFWAKVAGLDPNSKDKDELAKLAQLRINADRLLNIGESSKGGKLNGTEIDGLMKRVVTDQITTTTPGMLWGTNTKNTPLYQAMAEEDIQKVIKILQANGIAHPSQQQILDGFEALKK